MARFPVVYDRATGPTQGPTPGAVALMEWVTTNTNGRNLGIYNPRRIRGGSSWSTHAEGRALDIGFPTFHGGTPEGWALAELLARHHADLGVQLLIYGRKIWRNHRRTWGGYRGTSPHDDHIHCELTRQAAAQLTAANIHETIGEQSMAANLTALWQRDLVDDGYPLGDSGPNDDGIDGDFGRLTLAGSQELRNNGKAETVRADRAQAALDLARADLDVAAQRVEQLEAERDELSRQLDDALAEPDTVPADVARKAHEHDVLRAALEPFTP